MKTARFPIIHCRLKPAQTRDYDIFIGNGLLKHLPQLLNSRFPAYRQAGRYIIIITDEVVKKMYGAQLLANVKRAGLNADLLAVEAGEKSKCNVTKIWLEEQMLQKKCDRDTLILSLGGGVIGDLAGFVAATYMRGIPYIQIPTTLLAMVDSSIGGKVGINNAYGKNLIGAFWHPLATICDLDFLKNLPQKQLTNGLAEMIKIFLTYDAKSFYVAAKNFKKAANKDLIKRAIELKTGVIFRDEHDQNERCVVNFGHTIGHVIEKLSSYKIQHGIAVALGILVESKISQLLGILEVRDYEIISKTICDLGIDEKMLQKFKTADILESTKGDKKNKSGQVLYVLLKKIGAVKKNGKKFAHPVDDIIVKKALGFFL